MEKYLKNMNTLTNDLQKKKLQLLKKKLTEKDHYARSTNYNLTKIQRTNQTKVVLKVRRSPIFFFD